MEDTLPALCDAARELLSENRVTSGMLFRLIFFDSPKHSNTHTHTHSTSDHKTSHAFMSSCIWREESRLRFTCSFLDGQLYARKQMRNRKRVGSPFTRCCSEISRYQNSEIVVVSTVGSVSLSSKFLQIHPQTPNSRLENFPTPPSNQKKIPNIKCYQTKVHDLIKVKQDILFSCKIIPLQTNEKHLLKQTLNSQDVFLDPKYFFGVRFRSSEVRE